MTSVMIILLPHNARFLTNSPVCYNARMTDPNQKSTDHIDPRNGEHVCGLDVPENLAEVTLFHNKRKINRFVPYRVKTHPAPRVFGDLCEFLIRGEWVVCEFGGEVWWEESNILGNGHTKGKCVMTPEHIETNRKAAIKLAQERGIEFHRSMQKKSVPHTSEPVMVTTPEGDVYLCCSKAEASKRFKLHRSHMCDVFNGKRDHVKHHKLAQLDPHIVWGVVK